MATREPAEGHPKPLGPVLTDEEIQALLGVARQALLQAVGGYPTWQPEVRKLPLALQREGASFVTLYVRGELHGCLGTVLPKQALALDVAKNAIGSALYDPRFPRLRREEVDETSIEVSVLSSLQPIAYREMIDLAAHLRPGIDGVLVENGFQRGLLLPQVWQKLPDAIDFLYHVALKAQATIAIYDDPNTIVSVFQVHHYTQPAPITA